MIAPGRKFCGCAFGASEKDSRRDTGRAHNVDAVFCRGCHHALWRRHFDRFRGEGERLCWLRKGAYEFLETGRLGNDEEAGL
jgi:hypothetical protein